MSSNYANRPAWVYFIAPVNGGPIKIGCSDKPAHRLITLACWAPYPLQILAEVRGCWADEQTIHRAFKDHWSHSEWFRPHPDIYALINEVRATGVMPERFRGADGKPRGVPRKARRKWTDEQRANASKTHLERWAKDREVRAAMPEIRAFLERSQMPADQFDKGVGLVGAANRIRNNQYVGWRVREMLAFVRTHQAQPLGEAISA